MSQLWASPWLQFTLSALVIVRLPFAVPSDPVFAARSETYQNSFNDYAIPDAILRKPGKLSPEEFEVMKTHTTLGANMLADSKVPMLRMAERIARAIDAERYGVKAMYVIGSTKNATAGPSSDIDLAFVVDDESHLHQWIGYAVLADNLIQFINAEYGNAIPRVDMAEVLFEGDWQTPGVAPAKARETVMSREAFEHLLELAPPKLDRAPQIRRPNPSNPGAVDRDPRRKGRREKGRTIGLNSAPFQRGARLVECRRRWTRLLLHVPLTDPSRRRRKPR